MKKILVSLLVISALCGCTSTPYSPSIIDLEQPPVNTESTASIGDKALEKGKVIGREAFYLQSDVDLDGYPAVFSPGEYIKIADKETKGVFTSINGGGLRVLDSVYGHRSAYLDKESKRICHLDLMYFCSIETVNTYNKQEYIQGQTIQELIYTGKHDSILSFRYREYGGNKIQGDFSINVDYDLNNGATIEFKGAKLEVLEATNRRIKYKVLSNFND